jgi:hypothetical protein
MSKNVVLFVLSDTHCGHKLGLINPETILFDESNGKEWKPSLTGFQYFLWELYEEAIEKLKEFSKQKEIVIIILGDITHGNKYPEQLISNRIADQISIIQQSLKPLLALKNIKAIRLVFGTGSHDFGEGSSMLILKELITASPKKISIEVITHGLLNIAGKRIDYAHHGPGLGVRDWLRGNEARFYLKDIIYKDTKTNGIVPDLVLRGHVHGFTHESLYWIENDRMRKSSITILPSMCGMSEFAKQGGRSPSILSNGMVMYEITDVSISDPIPLIKVSDVRIKEEIL